MKLLLDFGADVGIRDSSDKTAFDVAQESGMRDVVGFLAKQEGDLGTRFRDIVGSTLLEAESQNSLPEIETVESQLSSGDTSHDEETAGEKNTSLHSAMENGRIGVVQRLLDHGADVDERDELLRTPPYVLASKNGKL